MRIPFTTPIGLEVTVIMRPNQDTRLQGTCFRPNDLHVAGNFKLWDCPGMVFFDKVVQTELLKLIDVLWRNDEFGDHSVDFDCGRYIGWESTAPIEDFAKDELEPFQPKNRWWGLRVEPTLTHLEAPLTALLTLRFRLENQHGKPAVIVESMYPGMALGHLDGDMTDTTGRVFFDFNHPGAPWPE